MDSNSDLSTRICCPQCGMQLAPGSGERGTCAGCGLGFSHENHVYRWGSETTFPPPRRSLRSLLKTIFHPLTSPFLPFRYITSARLKTYYRRVLTDPSLAEAWASDYLAGLALPERPTALDLGCGKGRTVALMLQRGFQVAGHDLNSNAWWKNLPDGYFQTCPGSPRLPWLDDTFDLVNEVTVIHYVDASELGTHVGEIARVLKKGGYWVLLEANDGSDGAKAFDHYGRMHRREDIVKVASACGLIEVDHWYEGYFARHFTMFIDYCRNQLSFNPLDISDRHSGLSNYLPPQRRRLWCSRFRKA